MTATQDHYDTLGVPRDADASAIRKAYFAKIRTQTPESDPVGFSRISEAYAVLSNSEKRKTYDAEERLPEEVTRGIEEAENLCEVNPEEACKKLAALAEMLPRSKAVRSALGRTLIAAKHRKRAIRVFRELSAEEPSNAEWLIWIGIAAIQLDTPESIAEAEIALKAASVINPEANEPYLFLADIAAKRERRAEAIAILDRGIGADARIDAKDLPLFQKKLILLAGEGAWAKLESTASTLKTALEKHDLPTREYAAHILLQSADECIEVERLDLAHFFHSVAHSIHPENEKLRDFVATTKNAGLVEREKHALAKDQSFPDWLRTLVLAFTGSLNGENDREKPKVLEFIQNMAIETALDESGNRRSEILRVKQKYPKLTEDVSTPWRHFDNLVDEVRERARVHSTSGSSFGSATGPGGSNSGCAVLLAVGMGIWVLSRL
jgi:tetratricopeptide (TPR) repeat protein